MILHPVILPSLITEFFFFDLKALDALFFTCFCPGRVAALQCAVLPEFRFGTRIAPREYAVLFAVLKRTT